MAIDLRVTELPTLATPGDSDFLLVAHNGISYKVSKSALVKQFLISLGDIDLSTPPSDGQVLSWSATLSKWVARSETAGTPVVDWNSIINRPSTFAPSTHTHVKADITDLGNIASDWDSITNKPATFPPEAHQHDWADITNVPNIATDWDSISGKPTAFPPTVHSHVKSEIADFSHTHLMADITDLSFDGTIDWPKITNAPAFSVITYVDGQVTRQLDDDGFLVYRWRTGGGNTLYTDPSQILVVGGRYITEDRIDNATRLGWYATWDGAAFVDFEQPANPTICGIGVEQRYSTWDGSTWWPIHAYAISHVHNWNDVTGKPFTYPPSAHTHWDNEIEVDNLNGNNYGGFLAHPGQTSFDLTSALHALDDHTHPAVDLSNYFTKTNLSTSGQATVHWGNITNVPDLSMVNPSDLIFNIDGALAPSTTAGEVLVVRNCTVDYVYMNFEDQSGNDPSVEINLIRRRNGLDTAFFATPLGNAAGWFKVRPNPTVALAEGDTIILRIISVSSPGAANLQVVVAMAGNAPQSTSHVVTHQNGGADELNVAGLSGKLADPQDAMSLLGYNVSMDNLIPGEALIWDGSLWSSGTPAASNADTVDNKHASDFLLLTNYTDANVLAKVKNVDGTGSGLDADTVDGKHSTDFLLLTSYTDAAVLAKVKNVDGSGSGLDADTIDGYESSQLAIKDASGYLPLNTSGATVTRNADQTITNNAWNVITWTTEARDTSTYFDLANYPTRVTVPEAGVYFYILNVKFAYNATGHRAVLVYKNGSNTTGALTYMTLQPNATSGWTTDLVIADVRTLNAGDYLECSVFQNSGATLNITLSGGNLCHFVILKVA